MKKRHVIPSILATTALSLGMIGLIATPASAHTADVSGAAICQTDGTYAITWTVDTSNVPSNTEGEVKVISPVNIWLYEWAEHSANHGLAALTPNADFTWVQTGVPGNSTQANVMFQIDWKDGFSHDPTGKVTLAGDCTPDIPEEPPVDVCPNLDGLQETLPEGYILQDGNCNLPPPPVVNTVCEVFTNGGTSTDLNDLWFNVDTRSAGHAEYVNDALHVWTDDSSSQAKVSEAIAASFPLSQTGELGIDATANPGNAYPYGPGLNLFVNFGTDGTGTLVYESVYGQDLWLTSGSAAAVKANAPVNGGGNGSQWHGTIDQWLSVYPDAQVIGVAYSLGSGVHGDWNINSITFNCAEHFFDTVDQPQLPEPTVEVTYSEWEGPTPTCEVKETEQTRTKTTTTTPHKLVVVDGQYQSVPDTENQTVVKITETQTLTYEGEDCPVTEPPTDTPSETPVPPKNDELAYTGAADPLFWILGALGLLLMGLVVWFVDRAKKNRPQQ